MELEGLSGDPPPPSPPPGLAASCGVPSTVEEVEVVDAVSSLASDSLIVGKLSSVTGRAAAAEELDIK